MYVCMYKCLYHVYLYVCMYACMHLCMYLLYILGKLSFLISIASLEEHAYFEGKEGDSWIGLRSENGVNVLDDGSNNTYQA